MWLASKNRMIIAFIGTAAIVISAVLFLFVSGRIMSSPKSDAPVFKMHFPLNRPITAFDPSKILLSAEYILLEQLYSPLVDFDSKGHLVAAVAKEFYWEENRLVFKIRENLKTADGWDVTARDALVSLKRALILRTNTHGNIAEILCHTEQLQKLDDPCEGIEVQGNTLILHTHQHHPFLVPMLAAIDFAVIPEKAIDPATLAIIDYRNTSGPYFFSSSDQNKMILEANRGHWSIGGKNALKVEMHMPNASDGPHSDPISLLQKMEIDHVSTITELTCEQIDDAKRTLSEDVAFHATAPIRLFFLLFTNSGRQLPRAERIALSVDVSKTLKDYFSRNPDCRQLTNEYYPPQSDGYLDDVQKAEAQRIREAAEFLPGDRKYTIGAPPSRLSLFKKMFASNPRFLIVEEKRIPWSLWAHHENEPTLVAGGVDSAFREDVGNLSYANSQGFFARTKEEGSRWLGDYMLTESKEARLKKLRDLHFSAVVSDPLIIPWASRSYVAITRKDWRTELPHFAANNPIWKIFLESR
jgi:hypothetical protein